MRANSNYLLSLLRDPCGLCAAALVMFILGQWASAGRPKLQRFGAALAGAALFLSFWHGIYRGLKLLNLVISSLALGFFTLGTIRILLSLLAFLFEAFPVPREEWRPPPPPLPPPPPEPEYYVPEPQPLPPLPTTEELAAEARERYEAKCRLIENAGLDDIELQSALEKAKQQYLRELDRVM